jgi:hypothetical protein
MTKALCVYIHDSVYLHRVYLQILSVQDNSLLGMFPSLHIDAPSHVVDERPY